MAITKTNTTSGSGGRRNSYTTCRRSAALDVFKCGSADFTTPVIYPGFPYVLGSEKFHYLTPSGTNKGYVAGTERSCVNGKGWVASCKEFAAGGSYFRDDSVSRDFIAAGTLPRLKRQIAFTAIRDGQINNNTVHVAGTIPTTIFTISHTETGVSVSGAASGYAGVSGSFESYDGVSPTRLFIELQAGGGGGGAGAYTQYVGGDGGGGGGGGYCCAIVDFPVGQSLTIVASGGDGSGGYCYGKAFPARWTDYYFKELNDNGAPGADLALYCGSTLLMRAYGGRGGCRANYGDTGQQTVYRSGAAFRGSTPYDGTTQDGSGGGYAVNAYSGHVYWYAGVNGGNGGDRQRSDPSCKSRKGFGVSALALNPYGFDMDHYYADYISAVGGTSGGNMGPNDEGRNAGGFSGSGGASALANGGQAGDKDDGFAGLPGLYGSGGGGGRYKYGVDELLNLVSIGTAGIVPAVVSSLDIANGDGLIGSTLMTGYPFGGSGGGATFLISY